MDQSSAEEVTQIKRSAAQIVEMDEMHSYVGHKKPIIGSGLLLIDLGNASLHAVTGSRDFVAGKQLWDAIDGLFIDQVMTDSWEPHESFVPSEQHVQSKADTFTLERYHSSFRYFLARLRRKIKSDSTSETILWYSVLLLMAKLNGELEYLLN